MEQDAINFVKTFNDEELLFAFKMVENNRKANLEMGNLNPLLLDLKTSYILLLEIVARNLTLEL